MNNKNVGLNIINYMKSLGMRVHPTHNIVYLEGCDPDTYELNDDKLDEWNDVRMVISEDGEIKMSCFATTEPGAYYTFHPMNPGGAARIQLGVQFKDAWTFGDHHGQDALVQCGTITVCRDFNQDGYRTGDKLDTGDNFGVDQHTTINDPNTIGKWSAGCLVGRHESTHSKFMKLCRESGLKKFDTVVFDASELKKLNLI